MDEPAPVEPAPTEPAPTEPATGPTAEGQVTAGQDTQELSDPFEASETTEKPPEPTPPPAPEPPKGTIEVGAQTWFLPTARLNTDWGNAGGVNAEDISMRMRIQAKGTIGPVSGFVQVQDARSWGFENSVTSNDANTDLHQGYLELGGKKGDWSGYARFGRQELIYGDQRMLGSLPWAATARSFDAMRLHAEYKNYGIDFAVAMLQPPGTFDYVDPVDPGRTDRVTTRGDWFFALELPLKFHKAANLIPRLFIDVKREGPPSDLTNLTIISPGGYFGGEAIPGLKYNLEGYYQAGQKVVHPGGQIFMETERAHKAWAGAVDIGYWHVKSKFEPGGLVRFVIASGEKCSNPPPSAANPMPGPCSTGDSTEFYNFYPTNHAHYGFMDLFGWRNIRNLEVRPSFKAHKTATIGLAYHFFQLHEKTGRWSNSGGANVGAGWDINNDENTLGHEIDLWANLTPFGPHLWLQPGYGVFIPTNAGKTLAGDDPQHLFWLWVVGNFGNSTGM